MTDEVQGSEVPDALEVMRRLHAMETAAQDGTLSREFREAQLLEAWQETGSSGLLRMAEVVAQRAEVGMRVADARVVPAEQLRLCVPSGVPGLMREAALNLVLLLGSAQRDWDRIERRVRTIMASPDALQAFVALCGMANGMARLVVQYDPALETRAHLMQREALEVERRQQG